MKKLLASLLVTLAVLAPAGAALAVVEDVADVLTPDAEAALTQQLAQYGSHRFDVIFVDKSDGAIDSMARVKFKEHRLDSGDALIAVAVKDKKVGVHVGQGFKDRGVDTATIKSHLKSDFFPQAKAGHFDTAAAQLARGLMTETRNAPAVPVRHGRDHSGPGFPWGAVFLLALAVGGMWWIFSRNKRVDQAPRIKALQDAHAKLVANALRLDEVETLGRFREGDVAKQYKKLARRSADLMAESRDFGEKLMVAGELVRKGKGEAELQQLEGRVTGLQSEVAAALTQLDSLEGTSGLTGDEADLPKLVQRLSRRYQELKDAYAQLQRRAPSGYNSDSTVERRLAEAQRLLTTTPVDAREAEEAIMEATDALDDYRRSIEGESDRVALRESGTHGGWASTAADLPYLALAASYHRPLFYTSYYEPPVVIHEHIHDHHDSGGGWFGGDTTSGSWDDDRRNDSSWSSWGGDSGGADASGSWDSGSSDSGSWDSGGGGDSGGGDW
jgi:uncharacterized membrane protein YgcG